MDSTAASIGPSSIGGAVLHSTAMEPATIGVYEREADRYLSRRKAFQPELAAAFSTRVEPGRVRADLGCGPGLYLDRLGGPVVGVDAAFAMLRLAREARPDVPVLQADLEALPFRPARSEVRGRARAFNTSRAVACR